MTSNRLLRTAAWAAAAVLVAAGAWGQSKTTGALIGRVTDASGSALPVC